MATSLQTANYGFGKYAPNDVTSYLTDYNGAMDKIDGAIKGVANVANEAKATGDSNLNNIASLSQGLTATNKNVENLGKALMAQQTEIDNLANDISLIQIGTFKDIEFTGSVIGLGTSTLHGRKIGNGIQFTYEQGTGSSQKTTSRSLNGKEVIDIAYVVGNPFGLTTPKSGEEQHVYAIRIKTDNTVEKADCIVYYDGETNMTRIVYVGSTLTTNNETFVFNA